MSQTPSSPGQNGGIITCVESLAAEAGARMLRRGGNAADAAIATAFAQGVVDPIYCGIGGGFHGLFYDRSSGQVRVVSAGGHAPLSAMADLWKPSSRQGAMWQVEGDRNRLGYQASMVPGFVRGAALALETFGSGRVSWQEVIEPAVELAADGFEIYPYLYRLWMPRTQSMNGFLESLDGPTVLGHTAESARTFLHPDGSVYEMGERFVQLDLGKTLARIGQNGPDEFYLGETALRISEDFQKNGGLLTSEDLATFEAKVELPVSTTFMGLTAYSEPAPTVGVILLELLNIIEPWDFAGLGWNSASYLDHIGRAMNNVFQDRMSLLGDPDFVDVPQDELLSKERAARLRASIEAAISTQAPSDTRREGAPGSNLKSETTHVSAMDGAGNSAAITHSVGMSSGAVTPGLGFQHNCHMVMFDPVPERRNSIAPGKRPITGGGPALFCQGLEPRLMIGSPGGARKVTAIVQALLNHTVFGMSLQDSVTVPRVHVEDELNTIIVEPNFPKDPLMGLARRGHRIRYDWYSARLAAVGRSEAGVLEAGSDPRGDMGCAVVEGSTSPGTAH